MPVYPEAIRGYQGFRDPDSDAYVLGTDMCRCRLRCCSNASTFAFVLDANSTSALVETFTSY